MPNEDAVPSGVVVAASRGLTEDRFRILAATERLTELGELTSRAVVASLAHIKGHPRGVMDVLVEEKLVEATPRRLYVPATYSLTALGTAVLHHARGERMRFIVDEMNAEESVWLKHRGY